MCSPYLYTLAYVLYLWYIILMFSLLRMLRASSFACCASIRVLLMEKPDALLLVTEAGIKLSFREEALATACVFYHSFCSVMTEQDYDRHLLVMACLSLAAKVQEHTVVKLGDVVNTCYRCLHRDSAALEVGDLYWSLKESVGKYELLLLRAMNFNLHIRLPHPYLLHYLLALSRWVDEEVWHKSHVTRLSWALLQDSFHTSLCLREPPEVVATAVLYLAVQCCRLAVPGLEGARRQWWEVLSPEYSEEKLQEIATQIMDCVTTINKRTSTVK